MSRVLHRDSDNTESDSSAKAKQTVNRLLVNIESPEHSFVSQKTSIFLADVESDVVRFGVQLRFCIEHEFSFPCLVFRDRDPMPVDWTFGANIPHDLSHERLHCCWDSLPNNNTPVFFEDDSSVKFENEEPSMVKNFFTKRLTNFLTSRFKSAQSKPSTSSGLSFKVVTSSKGLRVHYSPAYLFNPNLVFGSPTSPVTSTIQPGRYLFGVAGSGLTTPRFADAEFDIPPEKQADLYEL